jgi:hypothetical protein
MSATLRYESKRTLLAGDRYLAFLAVVLLGYALMGKGFAYIGLPPLYVGEIALLAGIAVFVKSGAVLASFATLPCVLLSVTMIWVAARTVPFVGAHGFDALRDSVVILYGTFAFIVIGLVLENARRIDSVLRYYSRFLVTFPAIPVGFWLTKYWVDYIPRLYGPPVVEIGASAVGTHLAGTAIFVLIGWRKVSPLWVVVWLVTLAMIAATNRGAALAVIVPITFAIVMLGRLRSMLSTLVAVLAAFGLLYAAEAAFTHHEEAKDSIERPVSAHQIVENAMSIIGQGGGQTEGTKKWRLDWWDIIVEDTLDGPHFWSGRGFGLNLAEADGFLGTGDANNARPPTRSPHSVHMTLLARAGMPGIVLWCLVLLSWSCTMLRAMLIARARGHKQWADLFLFVICYAASIIINASFDVALEGPMQGIWFWCLFGFGIGTVMVYRAQVAERVWSSGR